MKRKCLYPAIGILLLISFILSPIMTFTSQAGDVTGYVMETERAVDAYAEKSTSSAVVHHFNAGEYMFILGQQEDWIEIYYAGSVAYVPNKESGNQEARTGDGAGEDGTDAEENGKEQDEPDDEDKKTDEVKSDFLTEINTDELDAEMEQLDAEAEERAAAYERQLQRERRARFWRIGIGVIIVLIIAVGAAPTLLKQRKAKGSIDHESGNHGGRKRDKNIRDKN